MRIKEGQPLITDGPFAEGKEHVGGFTIVEAPDLDVALAWERNLAQATTLPIEVRPVRDGAKPRDRSCRNSPPRRSIVSSASGRAVAVLVRRFGDIDLGSRQRGDPLRVYDQLMSCAPSPVVALNRAVAIAETAGPSAALEVVDGLSLSACHPGRPAPAVESSRRTRAGVSGRDRRSPRTAPNATFFSTPCRPCRRTAELGRIARSQSTPSEQPREGRPKTWVKVAMLSAFARGAGSRAQSDSMHDAPRSPFLDRYRLQVLAGLVLVAAGPGIGGCQRAQISQPVPASPLPAPGGAAPAGDSPPGVGMQGVAKPVMDVMNEERNSRPTGTPTAEAVFAAAAQAGVPTSDAAQVLARMLGASYCENARTARGVVLSVCEFKDLDTLTRGQAYSQKTFAKPLPNRTLLANRNTLLTINPPDQSPAVQAEVKAIAGAFAKL